VWKLKWRSHKRLMDKRAATMEESPAGNWLKRGWQSKQIKSGTL